MTWHEPLFFVLRSMRPRDLLLSLAARFALALLGVLMLLVPIVVSSGQGVRGSIPRMAAGVAIICGMVALASLLGSNVQRTVTIAERGIVVRPSRLTTLLSRSFLPRDRNWNRASIARVELLFAEETGGPFGIMVVHFKHSRPAKVGLSRDVPARPVAELLNDYGIPVSLSGWTPNPVGAGWPASKLDRPS